MKIALKQQYIMAYVLKWVGNTIWVEDLYLALINQGHRISITTVRNTVWLLDEAGLIKCSIRNRRIMVSPVC